MALLMMMALNTWSLRNHHKQLDVITGLGPALISLSTLASSRQVFKYQWCTLWTCGHEPSSRVREPAHLQFPIQHYAP